jgi:N12 class adenine-specific DNA methylase
VPAEAAVADQPPAIARPFDIDALSWRFPLLPYQRAGVHRLVADRPVLLADEMGLGKTIQAIAACGRRQSSLKQARLAGGSNTH